MKLLLDTHVFIWLMAESDSLRATHRDAYLDIGTRCFLSATSYWEICIKCALGKLELGKRWPERMDAELATNGVEWLPVEKHHCRKLLELPPHHRDPFDRMLIAQALSEDMVLATTDRNIVRYPVKTL